jgi:predicted transcriptional regulator
MSKRIHYTISLPSEIAEAVEKTRKAEHRSRSELFREAVRVYLAARTSPAYTPTAAELRALDKGRAEIRRGNYLTLDELLASLASHRPKVRTKDHSASTTPRTRPSSRRFTRDGELPIRRRRATT